MTSDNVRYSFTIDFVEPDVEEYPLDELAADEEDGDRDAIADAILDQHTDTIHKAAERIEALLTSDEALKDILAVNGIDLRMGLSH